MLNRTLQPADFGAFVHNAAYSLIMQAVFAFDDTIPAQSGKEIVFNVAETKKNRSKHALRSRN